MRVILAPMQGLVDDVMRNLLTGIGGFDLCVSEFIRITHTIHSDSFWYRHIPELTHACRTKNGTPCAIQLLGSDADNMAVNALNAVRLGACVIDLNFGCPAPTVNKHKGGASLLKEPENIYRIVRTVRQTLPTHISVTAKMRLGYEDTTLTLNCAQAIAEAGAKELTVHARTKIEGYAPPAHWEWFQMIAEQVSIPVIANGDIFTLKDYLSLKKICGSCDIMLGRGALMYPDLARQIKAYEKEENYSAFHWHDLLFWIEAFFSSCLQKSGNSKYPVARLKQWLGMLKRSYPEADLLFEQIKVLHDCQAIQGILTTTRTDKKTL